MGQQVVFNDPMVLPEVSATLITPYSCPMDHHGHSFVSKNGRKRLKTGFDDIYLCNLLFYKQVCSMGQHVVFNYSMLSPKVPTTLVTPNSYHIGHHSH